MKNITVDKKGVSIIVCCYNSQNLLPQTIQHLANQNVSNRIGWEIIIVDNNSTDNTAIVAADVWEKTGSKTPFNIITQPIPGLSAAREMGVENSQYEYIIFVDDDNWLDENYVTNVYNIMENNPEIGILGGVGIPVYEEEPPEWFIKYKVRYAVGKQADRSGDISLKKGYVYGAGMVVRKFTWYYVKSLGFKNYVSDRSKNKLLSGGDNEICYIVRLVGYKIWYDDSLIFKHFIPKKRLTYKYFLEHKEGKHRSSVYLDPYLRLLNGDHNIFRNGKYLWLSKIGKLSVQILYLSDYLLRFILRNQYSHRKHEKYKELLGKLKGWLTIRGKYSEIYNELLHLKQRAIQYQNKS